MKSVKIFLNSGNSFILGLSEKQINQIMKVFQNWLTEGEKPSVFLTYTHPDVDYPKMCIPMSSIEGILILED